jgi:protein phosphatase
MQGLSGRFVAKQIKGERDYQEDDFGLFESNEAEREHTLMVLADGMGGHNGGGIASGIVTRSFLDIYGRAKAKKDNIPAKLQKSLIVANDAIAKAIENNGNLAGMGTTLLAVVASDDGLHWLSVGDSPLWLYRAGELSRLNEDHSMAPVLDDLVATGRMSVEEKNKDGRKNSLRSALMGEEISLVDTSSSPMPFFAGDIIILASDGLETLPEKTIIKIIKKHHRSGLDECGDALIKAVEETKKPSQDNCTVLLYSPPQDPAEMEGDNGYSKGLWAMLKQEFNKLGNR